MMRHLACLLLIVCVGCSRASSQAKQFRQLALNGSKVELQAALDGAFNVGSPASAYSALLATADGVWTNAEDQEIAYYFGSMETGQEGDHLAVVLVDMKEKSIKAVIADTLMH
jgi:hypothetical protein